MWKMKKNKNKIKSKVMKLAKERTMPPNGFPQSNNAIFKSTTASRLISARGVGNIRQREKDGNRWLTQTGIYLR